MLREKIVIKQREYIEYVSEYAEAHGKHIWLGGSFLRGNPTPYSDVDISAVLDEDSLRAFIYGYGEPVYLSYTTNIRTGLHVSLIFTTISIHWM